VNGTGCRRKGAAFELELAARFREVMPGVEVKRGLQFRSGDEGADVLAPPFWVEAKRRERLDPIGALKQAERDSVPELIPVAVCKKNRERAVATLYLDDFLLLVKAYHEKGMCDVKRDG